MATPQTNDQLEFILSAVLHFAQSMQRFNRCDILLCLMSSFRLFHSYQSEREMKKESLWRATHIERIHTQFIRKMKYERMEKKCFVYFSSGLFLLILISKCQADEVRYSRTRDLRHFTNTEKEKQQQQPHHYISAYVHAYTNKYANICCQGTVFNLSLSYISASDFLCFLSHSSTMRRHRNLFQLQLLLQTIHNKFNQKPLHPMKLN